MSEFKKGTVTLDAYRLNLMFTPPSNLSWEANSRSVGQETLNCSTEPKGSLQRSPGSVVCTLLLVFVKASVSVDYEVPEINLHTSNQILLKLH
jgi:hypothetical protein